MKCHHFSKHLSTLEVQENFISYNSRNAYIKRVDGEIGEGHRVYVYLCQDLVMRSIENEKLFTKAENSGMKTPEVFDTMSKHGIFTLIASRPIDKKKVLSIYYTR